MSMIEDLLEVHKMILTAKQEEEVRASLSTAMYQNGEDNVDEAQILEILENLKATTTEDNQPEREI